MLLRFIASFLLLLSASLAQAATILVWGDSLSAGYGLKAEQAWPALLQTRLQREGFPHVVVNASVSGETSAGGRSRLPAALAEHKPAIVVLALGANDGLRGLRPQLLADNLRAMVKDAEAAGARVLLVGMQMPPNYGAAYTRNFAATFSRLADDARLPFAPFLMEGFAQRPDMFLADGLHPNAAAQPLVLDTIWTPLRPLLDAR